MLLYAWELGRYCGDSRIAPEDAPDLVSLLAYVLTATTRSLLRRGIDRAYIERRQSLRHLRGRLDLIHTMRRSDLQHGRVACWYDELDENVLHNQIIRTTLGALYRDARIRRERSDSRALRNEIVSLYRRMAAVDLLPDMRLEYFSRVRLNRNNAPYRLAISVCRLIHDLRMPTEEAGEDRFSGLLDDELAMDRIFERFVRNFLAMRFPDCSVRSEVLSWPDVTDERGYLPSMKTDISLQSSGRRIVIDTKYYRRTLSEGYGKRSIHSENLYQLYTYLRTQEGRGKMFADAEGILLYPSVDVEMDESYVIQGHRVCAVTVDLAGRWEAIEERLAELVAERLS